MGATTPFYCKPCGEMLTEEQAECPFCMNPATPLDECISVSASWHDPNCEWHHEQVASECSCPTIGQRLRAAAQDLRTQPFESATMAEAKIMAARIVADVADEMDRLRSENGLLRDSLDEMHRSHLSMMRAGGGQ